MRIAAKTILYIGWRQSIRLAVVALRWRKLATSKTWGVAVNTIPNKINNSKRLSTNKLG